MSSRFDPSFDPFPRRRAMLGARRAATLMLALLPGLLLCQLPARAQVFKWVGADGKTHYGDTPPPANVRAEKKSLAANVLDDASLPFAVAEAVKRHPVTFYVATGCPPCEAGRQFLEARGIPFTEKTVGTNADLALMGGGRVELPQLRVGSSKLTGFDAPAWDTGLSAAGYPASNKLSKTYRNPAPSALAPVAAETPQQVASTQAAAAPSSAAEPKASARRTPARTENTVPGLRF